MGRLSIGKSAAARDGFAVDTGYNDGGATYRTGWCCRCNGGPVDNPDIGGEVPPDGNLRVFGEMGSYNRDPRSTLNGAGTRRD
jgi:hypothetical protein